jgi:hypothetical protein
LEPGARLTIPAATVDALEKAGLTNAIAVKLRPLADKEFKGGKALGQALKQSLSVTFCTMSARVLCNLQSWTRDFPVKCVAWSVQGCEP